MQRLKQLRATQLFVYGCEGKLDWRVLGNKEIDDGIMKFGSFVCVVLILNRVNAISRFMKIGLKKPQRKENGS